MVKTVSFKAIANPERSVDGTGDLCAVLAYGDLFGFFYQKRSGFWIVFALKKAQISAVSSG